MSANENQLEQKSQIACEEVLRLTPEGASRFKGTSNSFAFNFRRRASAMINRHYVIIFPAIHVNLPYMVDSYPFSALLPPKNNLTGISSNIRCFHDPIIHLVPLRPNPPPPATKKEIT